MLHIKYGHLHVKVSHGCLAAKQLWKLNFLYILYSGVARQQGVQLKRAIFEDTVVWYLIVSIFDLSANSWPLPTFQMYCCMRNK